MMELISREEALKIFSDIHPCDYNAIAYKSKIEKLPTTESRLKGKWIYTEEGTMSGMLLCYYTCSICEEPAPYNWMGEWYSNYCPNCGASMKQAEMESE